MEGTAGSSRDGGRGPSWSYRRHEETSSYSYYTISSSSRSGTIVSSTDAYTASSNSRHSSSICMDAALRQLDLEEQRVGMSVSWIESNNKMVAQPINKGMQHNIGNLLQELFRAPPGNCSIEGSAMDKNKNKNVLGRWFTELGVGWVLDLADYASARELADPTQDFVFVEGTAEDYIWSWIPAFMEIIETHINSGILQLQLQEGDPLKFALFIQEAMSKMLSFVYAVSTKSLFIHGPGHTSNSLLVALLHLDDALYKALARIRLQFHPQPAFAEVQRIEKEMLSLLSAKQDQTFEATWSALEEIRASVLKSMEDLLLGSTQTPQGSSGIHEATYLVMDHINFLLLNYSTVSQLVSEAASLGKYVLPNRCGEEPPFTCLVMQMVLCLHDKLITKSQLFVDRALGVLFYVNNSHSIWKQLHHAFSYIKVDVAAIISRRVKRCIQKYIEVCWAPMLACLFNSTPLYLGRNYSPLSKFESRFQKTYTTQKLWKVPDPELRKEMREVIIEKMIPGYTKYIEDAKVTNPKFTPQKLKEMLQDLFEG